MSKKNWIIAFIISGCVFIAFIDASSMDYVTKALIKIMTFTALPLVYAKWFGTKSLKSIFTFKPKDCRLSLRLGLILYGLIIGLYFTVGSFFDLSKVTAILDRNFISGTYNFLPVAFYIALVNSFLEEFFFRGFAYLTLRSESSERFSFWFSAVCFSLYHVFLMIGMFELWLYLSVIILLWIAGALFNLFDKKSKTLFPSWIVHGFANMGLNTIALLLLKII